MEPTLEQSLSRIFAGRVAPPVVAPDDRRGPGSRHRRAGWSARRRSGRWRRWTRSQDALRRGRLGCVRRRAEAPRRGAAHALPARADRPRPARCRRSCRTPWPPGARAPLPPPGLRTRVWWPAALCASCRTPSRRLSTPACPRLGLAIAADALASFAAVSPPVLAPLADPAWHRAPLLYLFLARPRTASRRDDRRRHGVAFFAPGGHERYTCRGTRSSSRRSASVPSSAPGPRVLARESPLGWLPRRSSAVAWRLTRAVWRHVLRYGGQS